MTHGKVIDTADGSEFSGVLRPNGTVAYSNGKVTRYIDLEDFEDLGLKWKPNPLEIES
jgi:hypothetical protein